MDKQKQIEEIQEALPNIEVIRVIGDSYNLAEWLYDRRIRKIPENAVVLTNEEFWALSNKFSIKELNEIVEFHKKKTRKETAEKFAERLKAEAYADDGVYYLTDSEIDEIAKEFTENKETPPKTGDIPKGGEIPDKNNIVGNSGDYCAVCGGYVAEGRQVCPNCENMSKGG